MILVTTLFNHPHEGIVRPWIMPSMLMMNLIHGYHTKELPARDISMIDEYATQ